MSIATKKDNSIVIRIQENTYEKFCQILAGVKEIPPSDRKWNPKEKTWIAHLSKENIEKCKELNIEMDSSLSSMKFQQEEPEEILLSKEIKNKLRSYQIAHTQCIINSIINNGTALDASDTGTGKTYTALAVVKQLNLFPIILTNKSAISQWKKVTENHFRIKKYFIANYEQYKCGNTLYFQAIEDETKWSVPENCILIFDEAHKCKNRKTINSYLLLQAKKQELKILCLSATIADNPLQMFTISQVLGICQNEYAYWAWAKRRGCYKGRYGMEYIQNEKYLKMIHKDIFPSRGSRIAIKELGDLFPENQIITECYDMNEKDKIQKCYEKIKESLKELRKKIEKDKVSILTAILRERQTIELLKIPTFVELAEDHIEEGASIIIFCNFKETIDILKEKLNTNCIITGDTPENERQKNIEDFQADKERIIICNIRAGGESISLHDINGRYNRITLISPTWSAQDLIQVFGRAHRDGGKSKVIQKIIFCSGTKEEDIAEKVKQKIENIRYINDGDLI